MEARAPGGGVSDRPAKPLCWGGCDCGRCCCPSPPARPLLLAAPAADGIWGGGVRCLGPGAALRMPEAGGGVTLLTPRRPVWEGAECRC